MGRDKALLVYAGEPQVIRAARLLADFCAQVLVSVRPEQAREGIYAGFDLVVDDPAVAGPAAGLMAAWRRAPEAPLLVLAVDLPRVDAPLVRLLLEARDPTRFATVFTHSDGTLEPLCAVWEPAAREIVGERARNGDVSLRRVLEGAAIRRVEPPDPARIRSVNTPGDEAALRERGDL
jgi:molybdopterin-guanine dinucleotide biosynthesis protein A